MQEIMPQMESNRPTIQEYNRAIWVIDIFKDAGPEFAVIYQNAIDMRDRYHGPNTGKV